MFNLGNIIGNHTVWRNRSEWSHWINHYEVNSRIDSYGVRNFEWKFKEFSVEQWISRVFKEKNLESKWWSREVNLASG